MPRMPLVGKGFHSKLEIECLERKYRLYHRAMKIVALLVRHIMRINDWYCFQLFHCILGCKLSAHRRSHAQWSQREVWQLPNGGKRTEKWHATWRNQTPELHKYLHRWIYTKLGHRKQKKNQLVDGFLSNMALKTHSSVGWIYEDSSVFPNLTQSISLYTRPFSRSLLPQYFSFQTRKKKAFRLFQMEWLVAKILKQYCNRELIANVLQGLNEQNRTGWYPEPRTPPGFWISTAMEQGPSACHAPADLCPGA